MSNPWTDPGKDRTWVSMSNPGNPRHADQLGVVLALVGAHGPRRLLDLGCGPGTVTRRLVTAHPDAALTCLDASDVMIERARETLAAHAGPCTFLTKDVADTWGEIGSFDVVTALNVVHHIEDDRKRDVFRQTAAVLEPGGLFVLNDRIRVDPRLQRSHVALWNRARLQGDHPALDDDFDHRAYLAMLDAAGDVPGDLEAQLQWLREAEFDPVACFWQYADRAVFGGIRR